MLFSFLLKHKLSRGTDNKIILDRIYYSQRIYNRIIFLITYSFSNFCWSTDFKSILFYKVDYVLLNIRWSYIVLKTT